MATDGAAAHSATSLIATHESGPHSGRLSDSTNVGYGSVAATGAIDFDNSTENAGENTPLLVRSNSGSSAAKGPVAVSLHRSDSSGSINSSNRPPSWDGAADLEGLPWYKRPSVVWLLLPFLLFAATFGGTVIPGLEIITQRLCREKLIKQAITASNNSSSPPSPNDLTPLDPQFCNKDPEVQSTVVMLNLWASVIGGILSALSSPKLGAWSDRYGRLRFLAISAFGSLFKDFIYILMFKFPEAVNVRWLIAAFALDGICGSFTAGMALTHAYASDCTAPHRRVIAFGWFHGCLFAGIALGPVAAAYILELTGRIIDLYYAAVAINVSFIIFVLFCVPESLTKTRQREAQEKYRAEQLRVVVQASDGSSMSRVGAWFKQHNIFAPLKILFPTGPGTSWKVRKNMVILASVDTVIFAVAMGAVTVTVVYVRAKFDWGIYEASVFTTVVNIARVSVLLIVLPLVIRLVRGKTASLADGSLQSAQGGCDGLDKWLISAAVAFDTVGLLGYALAPTGATMILSGVIASMGGMGSPTIQSSMTKHVPPDQVGQVLGAMGLLHALARVVAPAACNFIYARTVLLGLREVVFLVLAGAFGLAFFASLFLEKGVAIDGDEVAEEQRRLLREEQLRTLERGEEEAFL